jgi:hypothetical protein
MAIVTKNDRPWWANYSPGLVAPDGNVRNAPLPTSRPNRRDMPAGSITMATAAEGEAPRLVQVDPPMKGSADNG